MFPKIKDDYTTKNCTMGNIVELKTSFSRVNSESLMTNSELGFVQENVSNQNDHNCDENVSHS